MKIVVRYPINLPHYLSRYYTQTTEYKINYRDIQYKMRNIANIYNNI